MALAITEAWSAETTKPPFSDATIATAKPYLVTSRRWLLAAAEIFSGTAEDEDDDIVQ